MSNDNTIELKPDFVNHRYLTVDQNYKEITFKYRNQKEEKYKKFNKNDLNFNTDKLKASSDFCNDVFSAIAFFAIVQCKKISENIENSSESKQIEIAEKYFILNTLLNGLRNISNKGLLRNEQTSEKDFKGFEEKAEENENPGIKPYQSLKTGYEKLRKKYYVLHKKDRSSLVSKLYDELKKRKDHEEEKLFQLLKTVNSYHHEYGEAENKIRFKYFEKEFKANKDQCEFNQDEFLDIFTVDNLADGEIKFSLKNRNESIGVDHDEQSNIAKCREKLNAGKISSKHVLEYQKKYESASSPSKKTDVRKEFIIRATADDEVPRFKYDKDEDGSFFCWLSKNPRAAIYYFLAYTAVALKMIGTLLLDATFFFALASTFFGFNISFTDGSFNGHMSISLVLMLATFFIWYGAGAATILSRVAKIKKKILGLRWFSYQPFEQQSIEKKQDSYLQEASKIFKKIMKGLVFIFALVAAVGSALPAIYGTSHTLSTLANAFGGHISETNLWVMILGIGIAIGSFASFICFYTFKMDKSINYFIEQIRQKNFSYLALSAVLTVILGGIYYFCIGHALEDLQSFFHTSLFTHPAVFYSIFFCFMFINFFSVIEYTARLLTRVVSPITNRRKIEETESKASFFKRICSSRQSTEKENLPEDSLLLHKNIPNDRSDQVGPEMFAQGLFDLKEYRIAKLIIIFLDVLAFSIIGGLVSANKLMEIFGGVHLSDGKMMGGKFGFNFQTLAFGVMVLAIIGLNMIVSIGFTHMANTIKRPNVVKKDENLSFNNDQYQGEPGNRGYFLFSRS